MYCADTGSIPAIDIKKMVHVPHMTVEEAQEVGKAFGLVKSVESGNGKVCIPFLNKMFEKIETTIMQHRAKKKRSSVTEL